MPFLRRGSFTQEISLSSRRNRVEKRGRRQLETRGKSGCRRGRIARRAGGVVEPEKGDWKKNYDTLAVKRTGGGVLEDRADGRGGQKA